MTTATRSARGAQAARQQQRERILEAFSQRAKRDGIRAVQMGELASALRMSASTLYKHFSSKEALTLACVERWAMEVAAAGAAEPDPGDGRDPFGRFLHWLDAWADANADLSPAFLRDLRSDYPDAWERYMEVIGERQRRGIELLRPSLKADVDERVAFAVLGLLLDQTMRPGFADRLRISRHEAMRSAMTIWASGAMDRRGKLRAIEGERAKQSSKPIKKQAKQQTKKR